MFHLTAEDRRVWLLIGVIFLLGVFFVPFSQVALGVNYNYTLRTVALGGAILGIVTGVLGCFAVLRQESLLGDSLSHAALPGVGVAFLVAGRELGALLIGAGIASWLGVQVIQAILNTTRIKQDTAMGIVLATWFAAGIALLAYIQGLPDASQAGLDTFIFGQAAAIVESDVQLISVVGFIALVMVAFFWKEFKLITFDPEFASANGFRVGLINILLSTLIVVAIVLGLQLAGVILMVGMLIAPAIAARQWTQKLDQMVILSAVFGAFSGGTGAILSAVDANVPTGPTIIVVAFSVVTLSIAFAPGRGLIWSTLRHRRDRYRFAAQTTLRDVYRYALAHGGADHPVPGAFLRGIGGGAGELGLGQLAKAGKIQQKADGWVLTPEGLRDAEQDAVNQQLWDIYREYGGDLDLPLIAEDRQQWIKDLLPGMAVEKLEHKLKEGIA
ncbi:metal ABC transporter permease [Phototrophicus methaneseepsis]|uniref:Metal ABC transporter permease n=1 Tax=Phototrophicus methaneseepsis TaxID=2710758 RepID=A0A7S8EBZ4_9CHLR|nr:metal ABC transporter permease [Phototrophicus methaneseepsis]QPC84156.1 metal ABC transporter permease [Phototrophicus methaneseepsis]